MLEAFYSTVNMKGERLTQRTLAWNVFFFAELNQFIYVPDTMALKKSGSINYITEHNVQ